MRGVRVPLRRRGPSQKCDRCGLSHIKGNYDQCPHCAELSETELEALMARLAFESQGHTSLGRMMIACAVVLVLVVVLWSMAQ